MHISGSFFREALMMSFAAALDLGGLANGAGAAADGSTRVQSASLSTVKSDSVSQAAVTARSTSEFIKSLGVVTHIDSGNSQWTNAPALLDHLKYLGISTVRDGAPFDYALPTFITLAQAGIRFNILEANVYSFDQSGQVNATLDVQRAHALEAAVPGSVISFEGTNEYTTNHYALNGSGSFGNLAWGLADASALQAAVRADPLFANTTIIAPSAVQLDSLPDFSPYVNASNVHIYGGVGEQLQDLIINSVRFAQASAPGKPVYITETGVSSSGYGSSTCGVTDEDTQAIINVNALLDGFHAGAAMTFLYELLDEPYPWLDVREQHFGLFRADGTPKPVADAIHNLTTILSDQAGPIASAGSLAYDVAGLPWSASTMLLQEAEGVYNLVIWNGRASLHDGTKEIDPPASTITVNLSRPASAITLFDPIIGAAAQTSLTSAGSLSFQLSANPIIVEIRVPDAAPVQPATPVATNVLWNSGTSATVFGRAGAQDVVSIWEGSTLLGSVVADLTGVWSFRTPNSKDATHSIKFAAKDANGVQTPSDGLTLYGKAKQSLVGGTGDDLLISASGTKLTGGAGSDKFVFNAGSGKGIVTDFFGGDAKAQGDQILIDRQSASSFEQVISQARQTQTAVVITMDRAEIVLEGAKLASLDAGDFFFF
jgi:hypothetical protein